MKTYILTEKQLHAVLEKVITEELNEKFLQNMGNRALNFGKGALATAAGAVFMPFTTAGKMAVKANNIVSGNWGNNNGGSSSNMANNRSNYEITRDVKYEYGLPATVAGMGKKLEKKVDIIDKNNILQTSEPTNFGKHYPEEPVFVAARKKEEQDRWDADKHFISKLQLVKQKLLKITNDVQRERYKRKYIQLLKKWLNERDAAYEAYIKTNRNKKLTI